MGKHDRCCVASCNNDKRYPDRQIKRGNVTQLKWHRFTKDPEKRKAWIGLIGKGLVDFQPGDWTCVCSNHFVDGEPISMLVHPNPTLFLSNYHKNVAN